MGVMLLSAKSLLALVSLVLWSISMLLPVFRENSLSGSGPQILGYEMLLFVALYLSPALVGLPWLFLNVMVLYLAATNLMGLRRRALGFTVVAVAVACTAAVVGGQVYAYSSGGTSTNMLQVGIIPWTLAVLLVAVAATMRGQPQH